MPTISKPCFCCSGDDCCTDDAHGDLLPGNAMVTLPDIVPSAYSPCVWTTIHTSTVKAGRKVGLSPVFVSMGSSCDFGVWIRPKFAEKCPPGAPGQACGTCVEGRTFLGGERFQGWWCDSEPRRSFDGGYAPAFIGGSTCTYVKMEWQVYVSFRPAPPQSVKNFPVRCADDPILHDFGTLVIPITSTMQNGEYPIATSGLIALPSLCTWRTRWTTKILAYFNFAGSFGTSRKVVQAYLKLTSFLSSSAPGCSCGTGICTYGSYAVAIDSGSGSPPPVDPVRCSPPPDWPFTLCPSECYCHPFVYSFQVRMCVDSVGSKLAVTPTRTRFSNAPPSVGYCAVWALEKCTCPDDQYIEVEAGYTVTGRYP